MRRLVEEIKISFKIRRRDKQMAKLKKRSGIAVTCRACKGADMKFDVYASEYYDNDLHDIEIKCGSCGAEEVFLQEMEL